MTTALRNCRWKERLHTLQKARTSERCTNSPLDRVVKEKEREEKPKEKPKPKKTEEEKKKR